MGLTELNQGVVRATFLLTTLGKRGSVSSLFLASRGCPHALAYGSLPPPSKPATLGEPFPYCITLTCSPAAFFPFLGPLVITRGSPGQSRITSHVKLSWSATVILSVPQNTLLPTTSHFHRSWRFRCGHFGGVYSFVSHLYHSCLWLTLLCHWCHLPLVLFWERVHRMGGTIKTMPIWANCNPSPSW